MEGKKKLGLPSVVATGVGVIEQPVVCFHLGREQALLEHHLFFQWCWLVC